MPPIHFFKHSLEIFFLTDTCSVLSRFKIDKRHSHMPSGGGEERGSIHLSIIYNRDVVGEETNH